MKTKKCSECQQTKQRDAFRQLKGVQYKDSWDCRDAYCTECRVKYSHNRRKRIKKKAVDYLGGECVDCKLKTHILNVYDFHHRDPKEKEFAFGKVNHSFENLKSELDKCDLLCANCHRIRHSK